MTQNRVTASLVPRGIWARPRIEEETIFDALDSYLPPRMAVMARKVANALDVPHPATA